MDQLIRLMNKRIETLSKAMQQAGKDKGRFPEGRLRSSVRNGHDRYYYVTDDQHTDGRYMKKSELLLAQKLAQKEYNEEFLNLGKMELDELRQTVARLERVSVDKYYQNLIPSRKKLIKPYIHDDESFVAEWQNRIFPPCTYKEENKVFETRRGEMVRSKSEVILADMFNELGIPYRYEQPIRLKDGSVRYPDFTLLKISTREEIYFEHFGKMGDIDYIKYNLEKLDLYRANGIYLGKNLLITYETEEMPLDVKGTRKMIKEMFCS